MGEVRNASNASELVMKDILETEIKQKKIVATTEETRRSNEQTWLQWTLKKQMNSSDNISSDYKRDKINERNA